MYELASGLKQAGTQKPEMFFVSDNFVTADKSIETAAEGFRPPKDSSAWKLGFHQFLRAIGLQPMRSGRLKTLANSHSWPTSSSQINSSASASVFHAQDQITVETWLLLSLISAILGPVLGAPLSSENRPKLEQLEDVHSSHISLFRHLLVPPDGAVGREVRVLIGGKARRMARRAVHAVQPHCWTDEDSRITGGASLISRRASPTKFSSRSQARPTTTNLMPVPGAKDSP